MVFTRKKKHHLKERFATTDIHHRQLLRCRRIPASTETQRIRTPKSPWGGRRESTWLPKKFGREKCGRCSVPSWYSPKVLNGWNLKNQPLEKKKNIFQTFLFWLPKWVFWCVISLFFHVLHLFLVPLQVALCESPVDRIFQRTAE